MLRELINFTDCLDPDFKALGMKPKEGLHIFLEIDENNSLSLKKTVFTRKKDLDSVDIAYLEKSKDFVKQSWMIDTNKCIDTITRAIHSCSPYCLAIKRDNLANGKNFEDRKKQGKSLVYDSLDNYYVNAGKLVESENEFLLAQLFRKLLDTKQKIHSHLDENEDFKLLKDNEYVIFYFDLDLELYSRAYKNYFTDERVFNTGIPISIENQKFGQSGFFNGFPTKKPFLMHQSASFDIAGRISAQDAKALYEFQDIIGRNILPKPLPIFIHKDELKDDAIKIFKKGAENGEKLGYQKIVETLHKKHKDDFGNYYLLFYSFGEIKDFDYVSKFEYELKDFEGKQWEIKDLFNVKSPIKLNNVFDLHLAVMQPIFNNSLVMKTKTGDFQYRYFDDIDSKYCKSDNTFLLVMKYRKAFYDYIYKSQKQAVTSIMFNDILQTSILDDLRLDELKNGNHSERFNILIKLNIWFSLYEKFDLQNNITNTESMASKLQAHREFIKQLTKSETSIESDDQYAFAVGQVIYYLFSKSKTADTSYKRLEPFVQQVHAKELNKAIARLFDTYKHEPFSSNFRNPFAEVMDYETNANIRDFMPTLLAGIFSKNALFSDKEIPNNDDLNSTEE